MNWHHNRIPERVETIHLIAACGTGMGALACMLKDLGYTVTGSDQNVYPPMSTFLQERGIEVRAGFDAANLAHRPDLVVVGNAVIRENPEARATDEMGLFYCSMPQAVNHFVARDKKLLVVAGTHGKTTTASLLTWLLQAAGSDPSFVIGGILKNYLSNYRLAEGREIVIEGDEYDTAFFDKGPKFLHYPPHMAILTSVEFDHADIYRDLAHVKSAFYGFLKGMEKKSLLMAFADDPVVRELIRNFNRDLSCRVMTYGRRDDAEWRLGEVRIEPPHAVFEVFHRNELFGQFRSRLMGEHNLSNALAAIGIAHELGIGKDAISEGLMTFAGIRRRQEVRGVVRGITVMDDFAHHPTAVRETVRAFKPFYPWGRLIALFEPRTHASMRKVFQDAYPPAFDQADLVCIRKPTMFQKVPEAERMSAEKLVADIRSRGKRAHLFTDTESLIEFTAKTAAAGDLVLIMSNGGFDNIHERLLERLEEFCE